VILTILFIVSVTKYKILLKKLQKLRKLCVVLNLLKIGIIFYNFILGEIYFLEHFITIVKNAL
jgi:hypothetical protein